MHRRVDSLVCDEDEDGSKPKRRGQPRRLGQRLRALRNCCARVLRWLHSYIRRVQVAQVKLPIHHKRQRGDAADPPVFMAAFALMLAKSSLIGGNNAKSAWESIRVLCARRDLVRGCRRAIDFGKLVCRPFLRLLRRTDAIARVPRGTNSVLFILIFRSEFANKKNAIGFCLP